MDNLEPAEPYRIESGIMRVNKDLAQDFDLSFDQACVELLKSSQSTLVIDLSAVNFINSTYVGMIAAAFFQAQAVGKTLEIIARPGVLRVLTMAGLGSLIKLCPADTI